MDNLSRKVPLGAPSKASFFTFVPAVRKLPAETFITDGEGSRPGTGNLNKSFAVSDEETTGDTMSDRESFDAEKLLIKELVEEGTRNTSQPGTKLQLKPSPDHVGLRQTTASPSVSAPAENKLQHAAAGTASVDAAADKRGGLPRWQCHGTAGLDEVSSGFIANTASEDERSSSAGIFPTLASSRESIVSEGSDKEKSWSAVAPSSLTSPVSFSRTVSPCSSVLSGVFTPAVVPVRRHFLAPGSSLIHTPQTCFSSCESLFSSVCPQSPPARHRHRPPLTRLSLLTAILRKGRLPVLPPAQQRPYTPCWPVNPVTLSFCNACSAASSVASIPLELSSPFSSSVSIDSQSHAHRGPSRCVTSPPPVRLNELSRACPQTPVKKCPELVCSGGTPQREQVASPPRMKRGTPPRAPLSLLCSNFDAVSPPVHEERDYAAPRKLQHMHFSIPKSPELKPSNDHTCRKAHAEISLSNKNSPSSKRVYEREASAPQKQGQTPNPSISRLQSLSQQLRSPPLCLPQLLPLRSFDVTDTASSLLPSQQNAGKPESGRSCAAPKNTTTSASLYRAQRLSPSHCTSAVYPGWPSPTTSPTPTASPAPPNRDPAPSPSLSLRSTPSPRPGSGISDCSDREGKRRKKHKMKLSYKSLAAIPTNNLLLDQQAIDEQVARGETPDEGVAWGGGAADTHALMCSPAQLRQQSEELYAVIDDILANSLPPSLQSSRSSTPNPGLQNSSCPKSLGRETKYASICSLHPSTRVERSLKDKTTKPGVIRPMTAIPMLTVEGKEELHPNPCRQVEAKETFTGNKEVETGKGFYTSSVFPKTPFSRCDLQITEPDDRPKKAASSSFRPTEGQMDAFHTHI